MQGSMIVRMLVLIGVLGVVSGYSSSAQLQFGQRLSPLSTASLSKFTSGTTGVIPRLEPGLRRVQPKVEFLSRPVESAKVSSLNLQHLSGGSVASSPNVISSGSSFLKWLKVKTKSKLFGLFTALALVLSSQLLLRPVGAASIPHANTATIVRTVEEKKPFLSRLFNFEFNLLKFKKYSQLTPTQRLATTPVFYLANSRGNSYLQADVQAGRPAQKIITYFLSSEDANEYLDEMTQSNSQPGAGGASEFRLMTTTLEKVMNTIQSKKQSRKLGRYEMDIVHRIQPSARQYENAMRLIKQLHRNNPLKVMQALKGVNIPLFHAQGMMITRGNKELVTPYYFALEDLQEDWAALRAASAEHLPSTAAASTVTAPSTAAAKSSASTSTSTSTSSSKSALTNTITSQLSKLTTSSSTASSLSLPTQPKVEVHDLADVLCLADGLTPALLDSPAAGTAAHTITAGAGAGAGGAKDAKKSVFDQVKLGTVLKARLGAEAKRSKILANAGAKIAELPPAEEVVGFVPPRREIALIGRFYRNQAGLKNEFSKSKYLG